ncbi:cadherin-12-like [Mya arenaria]|uniref:cadherin-12-like n=1 Tax=Mya arenaria TaxID=6604 RepID=UPI0022DEBD11|nr:cadherin-12-like [Mya arenaria]
MLNMFATYLAIACGTLLMSTYVGCAIDGWSGTGVTTVTAPDATGTVSVKEDHNPSTQLFTVVATSSSDNADITYEFAPTGNPDSIATITDGVVSLENVILDFETETAYSFLIKASDGNGEGTATVMMSVTDVNEAPVFAQTNVAVTVAGNAAFGTTVATLTATDEDKDDDIEYSIQGGNTGNAFIVDPSSGVITVAAAGGLDKETTSQYALVIHATDDDTPRFTGTATLTITVGKEIGQSCQNSEECLINGECSGEPKTCVCQLGFLASEDNKACSSGNSGERLTAALCTTLTISVAMVLIQL